MSGATTLESLGESTYVSLTTFRKTGEAVATPVWVARDGDHLYVTTAEDSGKVKRLRHNPAVLLAPCDMRGRVEGDVVGGSARILDAEHAANRSKLFAAKYKLTYRVMVLGERLRRNRQRDTRVVLEITVNDSQ